MPKNMYVSNNAEFDEFCDGLVSFSSKLTAATYGGTTYAVSPVSVYLALSIVAECADGETERQLLSALNTDRVALSANYPMLYGSLNSKHTIDGKTIALTEPNNSIWLGKNVEHKADCIASLADNYYCYSYAADFANDNEAANNAVKKFVSDKTRGLIDKDFGFSPNTLFSIVNTLYLKDVWRMFGDELEMTKEQYTFSGVTSSANVNLLWGDYHTCRIYSGNGFEACYTVTAFGNRLLFIVPDDEHSLSNVFTEENINAAISYDYVAAAIDDEHKKIFNTSCLFPEFSADYDGDITSILASEFGISDLFTPSCDLGRLTDEQAFCSQVQHVTKLDVNRKGIEGAAVTSVMIGASAGDPEEYEYVYETFTVDKAFGFAILDTTDAVMFSGAVTDL